MDTKDAVTLGNKSTCTGEHLLDNSELEDLARGEYEAAMSFGVSLDNFMRLGRTVRTRVAQAKPQEPDDPVDAFLTEQLRMWKAEGVPAPLNELQSIHAWLKFLAENGAEKTMETMRTRMILLQGAAVDLHNAGPEAVAAAGIYDNRPDMRPGVSSDTCSGG